MKMACDGKRRRLDKAVTERWAESFAAADAIRGASPAMQDIVAFSKKIQPSGPDRRVALISPRLRYLVLVYLRTIY
jgi:hypothetical protein